MSSHKSDIEIARQAKTLPIREIGAKLDIPDSALLPYGHTKAKLSFDFIDGLSKRPDGKLILVTAITPTPAGEGKTTTSVGLTDGLGFEGSRRYSGERVGVASSQREAAASRLVSCSD